MNTEIYTLWLMPYNDEFPSDKYNFEDRDLRIRFTFEANDDADATCRAICNQLREHGLSGYRIAWKIERGDNQDPLCDEHKVAFGDCKPLSCEDAVSIMGDPEAAFNRALDNLWLGLALAMSESMNSNDPVWDNRKRIAKEKLRQETDTLESRGWSRGKIAARLRVDPQFLSRMLRSDRRV